MGSRGIDQGVIYDEILDCFWSYKAYYSPSQAQPFGCQFKRDISTKRRTSSYVNLDTVTSLRENRDFLLSALAARLSFTDPRGSVFDQRRTISL